MTDNGQLMTDNAMNRRRFLKVLGVAGGGSAALAGCGTDRVEKLIPYLVPPENQVPGIATWYATTCRECPTGCGLHVRVREGRAVKLEGNPDHPVNLGKLCARGQAGLQSLYNPDRVRQPMRKTDAGFEPVPWDEAIGEVVRRLRGADAATVWFVTGNEAGPFDVLVDEFLRTVGGTHVTYEPFGYEALHHANRQIFGQDALPEYRFREARYVLSFGADFLETWVAPMPHARGFAGSHGYHDGEMGRFVHVEPRMSMTAMSADEWIAPVPGTEAQLALGLAHVIVRDRLAPVPSDVSRVRALIDAHDPSSVAEPTGVPADTIERLAREFTEQPSLAVAGGMGAQHDQAHVTAAAVNILNYVAGNVGRTVVFGPDVTPAGASSYTGLTGLLGAMREGRVGVLFVHGANPAYSVPGGADVAGAMNQVGFTVSFARFMDETAMHADLILPDHDPLEQWNAYQPRANVFALQQPVMQPVFDTRQTGDVLLQVAQGIGGTAAQRMGAATYKDFLMDEWRRLQGLVGDRRPFEEFWTESLQRGGVWRDPPARRVTLAASAAALRDAPVWQGGEGDLTLVAYPSPVFYDGRAANRPWLQELPDPVTKITWSTWVELHPDTADQWGIAEGDHVRITSAHGEITVPAYVHPGIRRDTVAVPIGQGHTAFGRYAEGRGANVYRLLGAEATAFGGLSHYVRVTLVNTGIHERLPKTEGNRRQMGRGIAQATTVAALHDRAEGHAAEEHHVEHAAPVPEHIEQVLDEWREAQQREMARGDYAGEQIRWAMAIDLAKCTGCSACVTACYAENNIPTVGPELARRGREMSWMRIERYFEGDDDHPEARVLPMLCQHCGNAPCEPVCPVFAAYHTPDGLNAQVYNRCVGTRYCSNNCPYKVRYFNWFDHQNERDPAFAFPEPLAWQLNPDVTVRSKGVMEKCTFCVQRIRGKQHDAALEGRALADGEVLTACQQTCPSDAIVFGNLNDPASRVAQLARDGRGYHVLEGLNTRPAITYLKKVRNLAEA